jgi:hypothetical protein
VHELDARRACSRPATCVSDKAPGKAQQNALIEYFNARLRDELLTNPSSSHAVLLRGCESLPCTRLPALREIDDEAAALIPEVVLKFITCAEGCVISVEARHRYV